MNFHIFLTQLTYIFEVYVNAPWKQMAESSSRTAFSSLFCLFCVILWSFFY
jgi:hypothetical protein